MSFRPPPKPKEDRAKLTERLMRESGTDLDRWAQPVNLATQWDARAALAAEHIPAGASVLDIGCGAMALRGLLKPGCRYQPADVVARSPDCLVVDLNRREFPAGTYDVVTYLGVLEYVHDIEWPLARARETAPRLIVTYCTDIGADPAVRRGLGWVNDLTTAQFSACLERTGWNVDAAMMDGSYGIKKKPSGIQRMYICSRAA